ncbi:MAG: CRISPR-associated protein Cas4 [Bacteroidetes bacterium]|nr:CRISPR-associated protein Cas4 [Bacteroidota bacterium]
MPLTGTHINYYFHCHRHLWLFANSINMEQTSDTVSMGKWISESTYKREEHEIKISTDEDNIVLDFYDGKNKIIHEVKKSDKMEELHVWQVKYYISVLEGKGVNGVRGEIDYPKLRQKVNVHLTDGDRNELKKIRREILSIINQNSAPMTINKSFCKKCSYYELCYV